MFDRIFRKSSSIPCTRGANSQYLGRLGTRFVDVSETRLWFVVLSSHFLCER